ncbi:MAG: putative phage abortive infection protein [Pseudomonadota bacterium]
MLLRRHRKRRLNLVLRKSDFGLVERLIRRPEQYRTLATLLTVVVALWVLSGVLLYFLPDRGTFGDMFGGINALFSGLAFATLVYTIFLQRRELQMQRRELQLQRQEFVLNRGELKEQRLQITAQNEVLDQQNKAIQQQNLEATFFKLLELLNSVTASLEVKASDGVVHRGRECFTFLYWRLEQCYFSARSEGPTAAPLSVAQYAYVKLMALHESDVGHYIRTLYNVLRFLHLHQTESEYLYARIVRAQLSNDELLFLYYVCLSERGREKIKPLFEKYVILKATPVHKLLNPQDRFLVEIR